MGAGQDWDYAHLGYPVWLRDAMSPQNGAGFRCARDDRDQTINPSNEVPLYEGLTWRSVRAGGRK